MNPILTICPVCHLPLTVTELHCRGCDTTIKGHFEPGRFSQLSAEQIQFVEIFLQCEGKIKAVEGKLGISYPTVRARLRDVITAMGFQPNDTPEEPEVQVTEEMRRHILNDLSSGVISSEDALAMLRGELSY